MTPFPSATFERMCLAASRTSIICTRANDWKVSVISVFRKPGQTTVALIPNPCASTRSAFVRPKIANFEATYGPQRGTGTIPKAEAVFTM